MSTPKPLPLVVPAWTLPEVLAAAVHDGAAFTFGRSFMFWATQIPPHDIPVRIVRLTTSGGIPEELVERACEAFYPNWSRYTASYRQAKHTRWAKALTAALTPDAPTTESITTEN